MSNWELAGDSGLLGLYTPLPAAVFQGERWFTAGESENTIELVDALTFKKAGLSQVIVTLNLFKTKPNAGYYYYIPFLISKINDRKRAVIFERNGLYFYDAVSTVEYVSLLEQLFQHPISLSAACGSFQFQPYRNLAEPNLRLMGSTSNSLLFVTRKYLLKNYRRIYPGVNPELKISAALSKLGSDQIPEVYGFFNYQAQNEYTLGILMETVDNFGTGWERWGRLLKQLSPAAKEQLYNEADLLGANLGMLHRDLATIAKRNGGYFKLSHRDLAERIKQLEKEIREGKTGIMERDPLLRKLAVIKKRLSRGDLGAKFRIHGDLHLEQIIKAADGWKFLDFEGEPLKSIPERENYDSPLKDLASMLRSISYRLNDREINRKEIELKICSCVSEGYLRRCREVNADFLPDKDEFGCLLNLFQIERAVYECFYESKYRPDWLWIPQMGLAELVKDHGVARKDDLV